uniref:Metalloendopeptidase n=1 Tax=Plectus sambesii TaxID=2011161 RepID=A0A914W4R3_9BILA
MSTYGLLCFLLLLAITLAFNFDRESSNYGDDNDADEAEGYNDVADVPLNPEYRSGKFEGDIVLPNGIDGIDGLAREGISRKAIWDNGVIPYTVDRAFSRDQVSIINAAMADIQAKTCVRFREKNAEDTRWVRIINGGGCYSNIGRQSIAGAQDLSLGPDCFWGTGGTVRHELMHVLGFFHEQSRTDRDSHVRIVWENVDDSEVARSQFTKSNKHEVTNLDTEYDLDSIMHYDRFAFQKVRDLRRPTIIALNGRTDFGQRNGFSRIDVLEMNRLYECPEEVEVKEPRRQQSSLENECSNISAQKKMFLNGRCYVASEEAAVFNDAVESCDHLDTAHAHLAFASTRTLVNALYSMVLGEDEVLTTAYFVGAYQMVLHPESPRRGWHWMLSKNRPGPGIRHNAEIWRRGEPNDRNGLDERAAAIANYGGLDDVPEHAKFYYICEYRN